MKLLPLTGSRFGRLTVLSRAGSDRHGHPLWRCKCDCGKIVKRGGANLRGGRATGCGHHRRGIAHNLRHGQSRHAGPPTPEYAAWAHMKARCLNPGHPAWKNYGGRGIRVCDQWAGPHGFDQFLSDVGYRPDGLTLDRIDNDGNYEPGNVRWATRSEQRQNQRKLA